VKIPYTPRLKPFFRQSGEDLGFGPCFLIKEALPRPAPARLLAASVSSSAYRRRRSGLSKAEPPGTVDGALSYGELVSIRSWVKTPTHHREAISKRSRIIADPQGCVAAAQAGRIL